MSLLDNAETAICKDIWRSEVSKAAIYSFSRALLFHLFANKIDAFYSLAVLGCNIEEESALQ